MRTYLDFEKPVAELEAKVEELRAGREGDSGASARKSAARGQGEKTLADLYASLTPWQKTQVARHPQRPHTIDYVKTLITDFKPFAGDRYFGEDAAIVGGFGRFRGDPICIHRPRKGSGTEARAASTISAWRGRKAIARRCVSCRSPTVSACR